LKVFLECFLVIFAEICLFRKIKFENFVFVANDANDISKILQRIFFLHFKHSFPSKFIAWRRCVIFGRARQCEKFEVFGTGQGVEEG
jgi:hypothetical protein